MLIHTVHLGWGWAIAMQCSHNHLSCALQEIETSSLSKESLSKGQNLGSRAVSVLTGHWATTQTFSACFLTCEMSLISPATYPIRKWKHFLRYKIQDPRLSGMIIFSAIFWNSVHKFLGNSWLCTQASSTIIKYGLLCVSHAQKIQRW